MAVTKGIVEKVEDEIKEVEDEVKEVVGKIKVMLLCKYGKKMPQDKVTLDADKAQKLIDLGAAKKVAK